MNIATRFIFITYVKSLKEKSIRIEHCYNIVRCTAISGEQAEETDVQQWLAVLTERTTITNHKDTLAKASSAATFCLGALGDHSFLVRLLCFPRISMHLAHVLIDLLYGANILAWNSIKKRAVWKKRHSWVEDTFANVREAVVTGFLSHSNDER